MPTVNSEIKRIIAEKDAGIIDAMEAMREMLVELQRQVQDEIGRAATGSWDAYQLKQMLNAIDRQISNYDAAFKKEISKKLDEIWGKGHDLVESSLSVSGIYTGFSIPGSLLKTLKEHAFYRIDGLTDDAWQKMRGELSLGILGGKTPQEVSKAIGKNLTDPSIFSSLDARAEAITKTEMGRVFSKSAQEWMEEAAGHVDGLEKQWLHAGHPRVPRPTHLAANGQHVPVNEPFMVGGIELMFPMDPNADISETINCSCDSVPYHERWQ